jgi:hypothetical protein
MSADNVLDMKAEHVAQPAESAAKSTTDPNPGVVFRIPEKFTVEMIISDMAKFSQHLNKYAGAMLTSGIMSAANPATVGIIQASATLEQGAMQQVQQLRELAAQQQAMGGGLVNPGPSGPGGPRGPQRFN